MRPFILISLLVASARANSWDISPSNSCMQFGRDCPDSEPYTVNVPFPVETVKVAFAGDHYGPTPQINVVNSNNYGSNEDWNHHYQAGPPAPVETVKIAFTGDQGNSYSHAPAVSHTAFNPAVYQPQVQSWEDDSYQQKKWNDDGSYAGVSQPASSSSVKIAFGSNNGRYARSLMMPVQFTGGAPPAPIIRDEVDRYQSHHAPARVASLVVPSYAEAPEESVRAAVPESNFHISFGSNVKDGSQRQPSSFFSNAGSGHSGINTRVVSAPSSSYGAVGSHVPIVRHNEDITPGSSHAFDYSTGNGISHNEMTFLRQPGYNGYGASLEPVSDMVKKGTYAYTSPEGKTISTSYEADSNGFRVLGSHLPVASQPLVPTRSVPY